MEAGGDNSEVASIFLTVKELADLHLPGCPGTERAWLDLVKRENWPFQEVKGKGRGGIQRKFSPQGRVKELIDAVHAGAEFRALRRDKEAREAPPPSYPAPDGFVLVPRYNVSGSMGNGQVIHSEQVVDHLAFKADWVRTELGTNPSHLVLISAVGDSMEPTLRAHDLLLIDRSVQSVKQDAIYAFAVEGELRVKRIQRLFDGSLVIKSDNPAYGSETLSSDQAGAVNIIGRVAWSGRRM